MAIRSAFIAWLASCLFTGAVSSAAADELYVACHSGAALGADDVRDLFLGEKQFVGDLKLVPVDNAVAQASFLEKVLRMNAAKYTNSWVKKSFRDGVYPPVVKANDAAVLEFIKRTPGGCGYLNAAPPPDMALIGKY
jgi:hypothetical protein